MAEPQVRFGDVLKTVGSLIVAIMGAVMAYGSLNTRVDHTVDAVDTEIKHREAADAKLEAKIEAVELKRQTWEASVLPLDATQNADIADNTRRIDRAIERIDKLDGKMDDDND